MNLKTTVEAFGIEPLWSKQLQFLLAGEQGYPNQLFLGGIGSGKTLVGLLMAVLECMRPENKGTAFGVFAPTYRQSIRVHARRLLSMFDAYERTHGHSLLRRYHKSEQIMQLRGGAEIWLLSFAKDIDRLRGLELGAGAYCDEIEQVSDPGGAWNLLKGRVRGPGTGRAFASTTPKGWRGLPKLFAETIQDDIKEHGKCDSHHMTIARSYDNPFLTPDFLKDLKRQFSTRLWKQEVEARLLRPSEAIYPTFSRQTYPHGHLIDYAHQRGKAFCLAIDWGYTRNSALWIAQHQIGGKTVDVVFDEIQGDDMPTMLFRQQIRDKCKEHGAQPIECYADRASPKDNRWLYQEFPAAHVRTLRTPSEYDVWSSIESVYARLDPMGDELSGASPLLVFAKSLLLDQTGRGVVVSVENYKRRVVAGSLTDQPAKTADGYDHACDALRYFVRGKHGSVGGFTIQ